MSTLIVPRPRPKDAGGLSPTVVSLLLRINYNTILYWVRTKLARASLRYEAQQWVPIRFSVSDVLEIAVIGRMRDKGAPTRRIRRALRILRKVRRGSQDVGLYLDVTTDTIRVILESDILTAVQGQGDIHLINVGKIMCDIEEAARRHRINLPGNGKEA